MSNSRPSGASFRINNFLAYISQEYLKNRARAYTNGHLPARLDLKVSGNAHSLIKPMPSGNFKGVLVQGPIWFAP